MSKGFGKKLKEQHKKLRRTELDQCGLDLLMRKGLSEQEAIAALKQVKQGNMKIEIPDDSGATFVLTTYESFTRDSAK
jgi:hypothetical protein